MPLPPGPRRAHAPRAWSLASPGRGPQQAERWRTVLSVASWEPRASPAGEWAPCQDCPPGLGAASGESAPLRDGQEEAARFVSSCLIKCLLRIRSKQDHNRAVRDPALPQSHPSASMAQAWLHPSAPQNRPWGPSAPSAALGNRPLCLRVPGPREGLRGQGPLGGTAGWPLPSRSQVCVASDLPRGRES